MGSPNAGRRLKPNLISETSISSPHVDPDVADRDQSAHGARLDQVDHIREFPFAIRPDVRGKFLYVGNEKFWLKGVTYGTFAPRSDGAQFPEDEIIDRDFAAMAASGFNTVRTYTSPPSSLLRLARKHDLRVMVGLSWTQHVAFLDDPELCRDIVDAVRQGARACAHSPAVLCFVIGNEIPASIVRWHGRKKIEAFLRKLCEIVRFEVPDRLVTYVNYPTTEYLRLDFLDFVAFNVYLESRDDLEAYLARLQNISGERPLVLAEIGLDSRRNGEQKQAENLEWQISTAFSSGCAGACVFAWSDEWHRGGIDIEDWDFGLTARDRSPKPALGCVERAMQKVPFDPAADWPLITVVVCSLNGAQTIRDTMEGLSALQYPNFDVIVVDDGSTDDTASIAGEYRCRVISTENRGLSNARNTGWQEAESGIIAYIDDDAYPDPAWLTYLAHVFLTSDYVAVGGPNLAPPGDGWIADCVANAPGGPVHVLISDTEAEHIPGCNMAFRREALEAVGGFDPIYRAAGDDVDLCWRLQEDGGIIGFAPAAVVWHHRRNSVLTYWKQQQGYGKAEALLEAKWPQKYNALGHLTWSGRLYGKGLTLTVDSGRSRVYQGPNGLAPFQSLYTPRANGIMSLPLMPEWYLLVLCLAVTVALGIFWPPLASVWPALVIAAVLPIAQAVISAANATFTSEPKSRLQIGKLFALTTGLHLLQPLARLMGRLRHGLRPWRRRNDGRNENVFQSFSVWRESWGDPGRTIAAILSGLGESGHAAQNGGAFDAWDIEVRGGWLGAVRLRMAVEEHSGGKQLLLFKTWPRMFVPSGILLAGLSGIAIGAFLDGAWFVGSLTAIASVAFLVRLRAELRSAAAILRDYSCRAGAAD